MTSTGEAMIDTGSTSMVRARGLRKGMPRTAAWVRAVDHVDLDVAFAVRRWRSWGRADAGNPLPAAHDLGGLDRPSAGEIWLAGQRIDQMTERGMATLRRDAVGFVFQAFHLMDELTAMENVELPLLLAGRPARKARRRASDLLEQVGLADRGRHLPSQLSGVLSAPANRRIARALARRAAGRAR